MSFFDKSFHLDIAFYTDLLQKSQYVCKISYNCPTRRFPENSAGGLEKARGNHRHGLCNCAIQSEVVARQSRF